MSRIVSVNEVKIQNFYKYVYPEPNTGCWLWSGYTMPRGYGHFSIGAKSHLAHRISYLYFHNSPGDLEVCHKCDNPYCVNPDHLFLGTRLDNVRDMLTKNRGGFHKLLKNICARGHERSGDNIYESNGRRACKKCREINSAKYQLKKKEMRNVRN